MYDRQRQPLKRNSRLASGTYELNSFTTRHGMPMKYGGKEAIWRAKAVLNEGRDRLAGRLGGSRGPRPMVAGLLGAPANGKVLGTGVPCPGNSMTIRKTATMTVLGEKALINLVQIEGNRQAEHWKHRNKPRSFRLASPTMPNI